MKCSISIVSMLVVAFIANAQQPKYEQKLNTVIPHFSKDASVKIDYDIVYVRAPRTVKDKDGKDRQAQVWPNASEPEHLRASTDLMLLPRAARLSSAPPEAGSTSNPRPAEEPRSR